jgi:hypothetical protein
VYTLIKARFPRPSAGNREGLSKGLCNAGLKVRADTRSAKEHKSNLNHSADSLQLGDTKLLQLTSYFFGYGQVQLRICSGSTPLL